jgi:hypothetical protein
VLLIFGHPALSANMDHTTPTVKIREPIISSVTWSCRINVEVNGNKLIKKIVGIINEINTALVILDPKTETKIP